MKVQQQRKDLIQVLEGHSRDLGSEQNTARDSGNVHGIRDLTANI